MDENMECPICKKKVVFVGVHDDEGNYHGPVGCEYENDPWSGLSYALHHEGWGDCPMCTDGAYSTMGGMLFDTAEDAISALSLPNEPLTLEQLRASPHGKIKDSTLQSICNRANEIACRPPEGEEDK